MKLTEFVKPDVTLSAVIEWKAGIKFNVNYLSRPSLSKILRDSQELRYNEAAKGRMAETNPTKFRDKFIAAVVTGWEGVTPESVAKLVPVDVSALTPDQLKAPIAFDSDQLAFLMDNAYELEQFLQGVSGDISYFAPNLDVEVKNSGTLQSGN